MLTRASALFISDRFVGERMNRAIAMLVIFGCSLYEAAENPGDAGSTILLVVDIVLTLIASIIIVFWAKYEFEKRY